MPLPENYVAGIGEVLDVCDLNNATYLRRGWSENGYWYFYAYAYLVKTPLGTLVLLAIGGVMVLPGGLLARRGGQAHFAPKTPQNEPVPYFVAGLLCWSVLSSLWVGVTGVPAAVSVKLGKVPELS